MSDSITDRGDLEFPITWDGDVVRQYLTPESHQKSRQEFIDTHINIDKIQTEYLFPHPDTPDFVTQGEFRDAILRSNVTDDNRIFILRGETGSGKSQLCQWLEYQIGDYNSGLEGDDEHVALHVSRSNTRIRDILEILTAPLDETVSTTSVEELDPERVADAIIATLDAFAPTEQSVDSEDLRKLASDEGAVSLRGILEQNIQEYQSAVVSENEINLPDLIKEKDYRDLAFDAFGTARGGDDIFPALRDKIHQILSQNLGVADFQGKLEELSQQYVDQGIRPVLICEDLTTFSVLKEQLLDHLFQLDSGAFDVVLGWTTGWEQDSLDRALGVTDGVQTYMKDRAEGYLSTTDDAGRAHFLNEDVTVELVRKYMSVIHEKSDQAIDIDQSAYDELYPFNAGFVRRAYDNLVQDGVERRTPRLLLIRVIRECLNSDKPPLVAAESNPYIKDFPVEIELQYDRTHKNLSKWYGRKTLDGNISVPLEIAETFNVEYETDWVRQSDNDSEIVYDAGGFDLSLSVGLEGTRSPGNRITFHGDIDNRPQDNVTFTVDGEEIGQTDKTGELDFTLPDEETRITVEAKKKSLSTTETYEVAEDTLDITPSVKSIKPGDNLRLSVKYNGEKVEGATVYQSGQSVGETDASGAVVLSPDVDGNSLRYEIEHKGLNATQTIDSNDPTRKFPVNPTYSADEVNRRETEFQNWVSEGVKYNSSDTLIEGAIEVLRRFDSPTELRNPNSLSSAGDAIYFDRGDHIPISLQGAYDSQASLSTELPFGTEHSEIYQVLFWAGIAEDGLPDPSMVSTDYDLLRGWTDDIVAQFREDMRTSIEQCLPENMGIEEFIVYYRFLIYNVGCGRSEIDDDVVFTKLESPYVEYDHPIKDRFDEDDGIMKAYVKLMKNRTASRELAKSFFLLKSGRGEDRDGWLVDKDRLDSAVKAVRQNRDQFLKEAMQIDTSSLAKAFRVKSSRSARKTAPLHRLLEAMRETAREIVNLDPRTDAEHVTDGAERVNKWFDPSQEPDEVKRRFDTVFNAVDDLPVASKKDLVGWEKTQNKIDNGLDLDDLESKINQFENTESSGTDLISNLHAFESTINELVAWNVYSDLGEMINQLDNFDPEGGDSFDNRVRQVESFKQYRQYRSNIETRLEDL